MFFDHGFFPSQVSADLNCMYDNVHGTLEILACDVEIVRVHSGELSCFGVLHCVSVA